MGTLSGRTPAGRGAGIAAGLLAASAFAASGPFVKPLLTAGWTPGAAVLARIGVATALLAGPALWLVRGRLGVVAAEWRLVLAFGAMGVAGCQAFYFAAVDRLPVAVALLVEYTSPVLLVGYAWLRHRRSPGPAVLAGAALAMAGLALVLDLSGAGVPDGVGIAFAFGAAVCGAAYFLLSARPTDLPSLTLAGAGMVVALVVLLAAAAAGIVPLAAPRVDVDVQGVAVPWWLPVLAVGTVATAVAYGVGVLAVSWMGSRLASFVALAEVLVAVLIAWALLGEAPTGVQLAGAALVVVGVVLVRASGEEAAPTTAPGPVTVDATAAEAAR